MQSQCISYVQTCCTFQVTNVRIKCILKHKKKSECNDKNAKERNKCVSNKNAERKTNGAGTH